MSRGTACHSRAFVAENTSLQHVRGTADCEEGGGRGRQGFGTAAEGNFQVGLARCGIRAVGQNGRCGTEREGR